MLELEKIRSNSELEKNIGPPPVLSGGKGPPPGFFPVGPGDPVLKGAPAEFFKGGPPGDPMMKGAMMGKGKPEGVELIEKGKAMLEKGKPGGKEWMAKGEAMMGKGKAFGIGKGKDGKGPLPPLSVW